MQRSNKTLKFRITFADGESFSEQCRDSLGGFVNLMRRFEARVGRVQMDLDARGGVDSDGRRFEIVAVD